MTSHIFITGPHRSGGSLLSRMLGAHTNISIHYTSIKFFTFCHNKYQPIEDPENVKKLLEEVSYRVYQRYELKINQNECLALLKKNGVSYANIASALWSHCVKNSDKSIFGEVEASKWRAIPDFLRMFPKGKAILIIRDIRDVVNSFKKHTIAQGNDYLTALFNVVDAIDHWKKFSAEYPDRFHMIKYEQLKADPEQEMKTVCKFLQVPYESKMLSDEYWLDQSGEKKWAHTKDTSFPEEKVSGKNPVGRWKKMITPEDLFLTEWIGRKQMESIGLTPTGKMVQQDTFNRAIEMITSTDILRDSFKNWCETGGGDEKYPLDPTSPSNWDMRDCKNPASFNKEIGA